VSRDEVVRQRSAVAFAVGDAAALVVFVIAGIRSHRDMGALDVFLRNAVPLEVMWFAVAAVFGAYRRPGLRTLLRTWIVAVPAGLIVRSLWVGSPSGIRMLTFLAIGLVFTLLFLLIGRAGVGFIGRMRSHRGLERGSIASMSDRPTGDERAKSGGEDEDLKATRRLIASVEELRALLAPLSPDERERVLALAREIAERPDRPSVDR
jgi:hypothetical protein